MDSLSPATSTYQTGKPSHFLHLFPGSFTDFHNLFIQLAHTKSFCNEGVNVGSSSSCSPIQRQWFSSVTLTISSNMWKLKFKSLSCLNKNAVQLRSSRRYVAGFCFAIFCSLFTEDVQVIPGSVEECCECDGCEVGWVCREWVKPGRESTYFN